MVVVGIELLHLILVELKRCDILLLHLNDSLHAHLHHEGATLLEN